MRAGCVSNPNHPASGALRTNSLWIASFVKICHEPERGANEFQQAPSLGSSSRRGTLRAEGVRERKGHARRPLMQSNNFGKFVSRCRELSRDGGDCSDEHQH